MQIEKTKTATGAKISIREDGNYYQELVRELRFLFLSLTRACFFVKEGDIQKLQKVEITLSDCLACSGCITSAESVLITQQSQEELLRVFAENKLIKEVFIAFHRNVMRLFLIL